MDIKRTVLWVVFTMSLLILWDNWGRQNGKSSLFFPSASTGQTAESGKPANADSNAQGTTAASAANSQELSTTKAIIKGETVTITTDVMKVDIDSLGGDIKRLELLKYVDSEDEKKHVVLFENTAERTYAAQTGLASELYPNHKSAFVVLPGKRDLGSDNELTVSMEAEQNGVKLVKTLKFTKGSYQIEVSHTVVNNTASAINPSLYLKLIHDGTKPKSGGMFSGTTEFYNPAVYSEEKHFQKLDFADIEKNYKAKLEDPNRVITPNHVTSADNGWVAVIQHFFVSAFIPAEKTQRSNITERVRDNVYSVSSLIGLGQIAPGASVTSKATLYSGPQETAILEKVATGLDLVKDYWNFSMIAKPMFFVMEFLHKFLGNWGWTIVVFTIGIKLALFPLSAAGYRSMAKMKVLTPKMTALKERYKNEPQKLNQAMMELYKTEKINPLGGCLPMLIQMPVFLSLYWVLQASVEMRGAPWVLWIHDLSKPDPIFVLPIIYMISMFITTKLSPAPADPIQAKMMLFMPVMFSVMFLFFPSGLVLYWVVNNVLQIGQQWVINNKLIPVELRT